MRTMLALAAILVAGTAAAEEPNPAIGRLNHASFRTVRHCTMFAVAPRTVVSAAHCIGRTLPGEFRLLFGYERMQFVARMVPVSAERLRADVAVLCLGEDAPATLTVGREVGAEVRAIGYGIPAQHLLQGIDCPVTAGDERQILLDCGLSQGASGAPVLNRAGEVVAVASESGSAGTIASLLPEGIAGMCPG